jgi:hypothetical protein
MDGWNLAVSVVATVISLVALFFALRTDRRDTSRRNDELKPRFTAEIEEMPGASWCRLRLQLHTDNELARVGIRVVSGKGLSFTGSQRGVDAGAAHPILAVDDGPLREDPLTWRVQLDQDRDTEALLLVDCKGTKGGSWQVIVPVEVPYEGSQLGAASDALSRPGQGVSDWSLLARRGRRSSPR